MKKSKIKVEEITQTKVAELKPHPKNPRIHDQAIPHLIDSIRRFGFKSPIMALWNGTILAGHGRWKAAKKMGLKTVPVVFVDMAEKEAEAFMLADNKVAEHSDWETGLLVQLAQTQSKPIPGFSSEDIGALLKSMEKPKSKEPPKIKGKSRLTHECPKCHYKWQPKDE